MCIKHFRRQRTPENLSFLRETVRGARETAKRVKQEDGWNGVSPLPTRTPFQSSDLSSGPPTAQIPNTLTMTIDRLVLEFSVRTSSISLPARMRIS